MIKEDLIILGSEECAPCKVLEKYSDGRVPSYDIVKSDEAYKIAQETQIMGVPAALEKRDGKWNKCNISYKGNKVKIQCKNKEIELERK